MLQSSNNANAFASTFLFFAAHKASAEKIKKSLQANTQRQTVMDRHSTTEENNEPLTAPTRNWRLSASYDSFVVKQTFVLRMNICGENRQLLVAAKRCMQLGRLVDRVE